LGYRKQKLRNANCLIGTELEEILLISRANDLHTETVFGLVRKKSIGTQRTLITPASRDHAFVKYLLWTNQVL